MAQRNPIVYSSDAALNNALSNFGGALGQALGVYSQPQQQQEPYSIFEIPGLAQKLGYSKEALSYVTPDDYAKVHNLHMQYLPYMSKEDAYRTALESVLKGSPESMQKSDTSKLFQALKQPQAQTPQGLNAILNAGNQPQEPSMWNSIKSGLTGGVYSNLGGASTDEEDSYARLLGKGLESSAAGKTVAAIKGEGFDSFQERTKLKGPTWAKKMTYDLTRLLADAPVFSAGAALGSAGGPVGSGAGAFALPAAIHTSLDEYMQYADKGGKASFGDYLKSFGNVSATTASAGAQGALMGLLGGLKVPFDKIPGLKNILNLKGSAPAKALLDTATGAGIFTGVTSLAEGKFPTMQEYGDNLALFLGFKFFHEGSNAFKGLYDNLKAKGVAPEQAASMIKEKIQEKGYDANNSSDMLRVIEDLTKEPSKAKEVFKEKVYMKNEPEISIKETAKRIAERPVEEYIASQEKKAIEKNKPLTVRETLKRENARDAALELKKEIQNLESSLEEVNDRLAIKGIGEKLKSLNEKAKLDFETRLKDAKKSYKDANDIATKGKKYQTQEELEKDAAARIERLLDDVVNPTSDSAIKTQSDFLRDQKYVNDYLKLIDKGAIPEKAQDDFYINSLKAYQDAYRRKIASVDTNLETAPKKEVKLLEDYKHLLETNLSINDSKIKLQKDKINSLKNLEGARGALVKSNLKEFRKDIASLQKEFVKVSKMEDLIEKRSQKAALESISSPDQQAKLIRKIEQKDMKGISDITKIPESEVKEINKRAQITTEDIFKKVEDGQPIGKLAQTIDKYVSSIPGMKNRLFKTIVINGLKQAIGKKFGIRVPDTAIKKLGIGTGTLASSTIIYNFFKNLYNKADETVQASKIKKAGSIAEKQKLISEIKRKGYKPAAIKRIIANST